MDWQSFFFNAKQRWPECLQERAKRRFIDPILAEEAYNYAFEKLSAENWRLLNRYQGRASQDTFLIAVYSNLLEDFARVRFGRHRPPVWLERLGTLWTRIYYLVCIERLDRQTIVQRLATPDGPDEVQVNEILMVIRARIPRCGEELSPRVVSLSDEASDALPGPETCTPEGLLAQEDLAVLFHALAQLLIEPSAALAPATISSRGWNAQDLAKYVRRRWQSFRSALTLTSQERLLLCLIYQEDKTIAAAARILGMAEHQARRQHVRLLKRLHSTLQQVGLTAETLRSLLD